MTTRQKTLFVFLMCMSLTLRGAEFQVVENGKAMAEFIVPSTLPQKCQEDIEFFNKEFAKVTGFSLPICKKASGKNKIIFEIVNLPMPEDDTFSLEFPDENTMKIKGTKRSVRWALLEILEKYCDVTYLYWVNVHRREADYPQKKNILIPIKNATYKPSMNLLRVVTDTNLAGKTAIDLMREKRETRPAHWAMVDVFPMDKYAPFNQKACWPDEILPVIGGKKYTPPARLTEDVVRGPRHWQPCWSEPKTTELAISNILELLEKDPDRRIIRIAVGDGGNYCECERCLKAVAGKKTTIGHRDYSVLYWTFVNKVVEAVTAKHPDVFFTAMAYREVITPPPFKLHKNVMLSICFESYPIAYDKELAAKRFALIDSWSAKCSNLMYWDYIFGGGYPPRMFFKQMADFYKKIYKKGVRGVVAESGQRLPFDGPKWAFLQKLYWNVNLDVDRFLDQWCAAAVGKNAAPYLREYYQFWDDFWTGEEIRKTGWWQSRTATYLHIGSPLVYLALKPGDMAYCRKLMENVVAHAETKDQKRHSKLLMLTFQLTELMAKTFIAELIPADGTIKTPDDALAILNALPVAIKSAKKTSELIKKLPVGYTLHWRFSGMTDPMALLLRNIALVANFSSDKEVKRKLMELSVDKNIPEELQAMFKSWGGVKLTNLYVNGSFEKLGDLSRQIMSPPQVYEISSEKTFDGKFAVKFRNGKFKMATVPVTPSKTYMFSARIFMPKNDGESRVALIFAPFVNKISVAWVKFPFISYGAGQWHLVSGIYKIPEKSHRGKPNFLHAQLYAKNLENDEVIYADDFKLLCLDDIKNSMALKLKAPLLGGKLIQTVSAEGTKTFEDGFEKFNKWSQNPACKTEKFGGGGDFSIVESGKEGKCLKVVTNEKQTFMMNVIKPYAATSGKTLNITLFFKGNGSVQFAIMGKGEKPIWYGTRKAILKSQEWKKYSVILPLKLKTGGGFEKTAMRMNVFPNSDILIDNMSITVH